MRQYHLAIDIGASSGRHILGWIENGVVQTQEIYRFSNAPEMQDGHLKWNVEKLFQEIVNGLKKASALGKIPCNDGMFDVKPFAYGQSFALRVAKVYFK